MIGTYTVMAYSEASFGILQVLMDGTFPDNTDDVDSICLDFPKPAGRKSTAGVEGEIISVTDRRCVTLFFTAEDGFYMEQSNVLTRAYLTDTLPS